MLLRHFWRAAPIFGLTLLCVAAPAQAETWKQVADAPIEGLETCVDVDSIRDGSGGKAEFRMKFCGLAGSGNGYQVDCSQDTSKWSTYDPDKSTWAVMHEIRDGAFRETRTAGGSPLVFAAKWVCENR